MGKIQIPAKIRIEDFDAKDKDIVDKIGQTFNSFSDEVYQLVSGNLDMTNLNRQLVDVDIQIDSLNKLVSQPQIKTTVNGRVRGVNVINSINQVNPNTYPSSTPGVSFTTNTNILTILNVTGLQASSQYKLTLELIV